MRSHIGTLFFAFMMTAVCFIIVAALREEGVILFPNGPGFLAVFLVFAAWCIPAFLRRASLDITGALPGAECGRPDIPRCESRSKACEPPGSRRQTHDGTKQS